MFPGFTQTHEIRQVVSQEELLVPRNAFQAAETQRHANGLVLQEQRNKQNKTGNKTGGALSAAGPTRNDQQGAGPGGNENAAVPVPHAQVPPAPAEVIPPTVDPLMPQVDQCLQAHQVPMIAALPSNANQAHQQSENKHHGQSRKN